MVAQASLKEPDSLYQLRLCASLGDFISMIAVDPAKLVLELGDFLCSAPMEPDELDGRLTAFNKTCQQKYTEKGATVADLAQNPEKRPRFGKNIMHTLTTGCQKVMHLPSGQLFSASALHSVVRAGWMFGIG